MSGRIIFPDDKDKEPETPPEPEKFTEKKDEVQELRKRIQELEEKVEKQSSTKSTESKKTDDVEEIRRDLSYQKKQRELDNKAESMKKDVGTITLVAVIGGIFGINGLGHFMIGKTGTGVAYLVGGILTMVVVGVLTMGYGAIIPWLIFLIISSQSARSSVREWNFYIDEFVEEPTWQAIEGAKRGMTAKQSKSKPKTKKISSKKRKVSGLVVMGIIFAVVATSWLVDNYFYDLGIRNIGGFTDQNREPSKTDMIRQHCLLANGVLYDRSSYFGKPNSPRCPYGTVADLDAELTWWNPFD